MLYVLQMLSYTFYHQISLWMNSNKITVRLTAIGHLFTCATELSMMYVDFILTVTLWGRCYYYHPFFSDKKGPGLH